MGSGCVFDGVCCLRASIRHETVSVSRFAAFSRDAPFESWCASEGGERAARPLIRRHYSRYLFPCASGYAAGRREVDRCRLRSGNQRKQSGPDVAAISPFEGIADESFQLAHVRYVPLADIGGLSHHGEVASIDSFASNYVRARPSRHCSRVNHVARPHHGLRRSPSNPDTGDRTPDYTLEIGAASWGQGKEQTSPVHLLWIFFSQALENPFFQNVSLE